MDGLELCREVRLRLSEMTGVKRCIFSLHPAATAGGLTGFTPNVQVTAVTPQHGVMVHCRSTHCCASRIACHTSIS
jgi:hypothetical protein